MIKRSFNIFLFLSITVIIFTKEGFADLTIKVNHGHIKIDFFYHGSTVSISGESDPNTDLVIKVASPDSHQSLKKKGRIAGLLWMNIGELRFEYVPNLYLLYSTKRLEEMLKKEEAVEHRLGYNALERDIEITPISDETEKAKWFKEFIRFKESSRLYVISSGRISIFPNNGREGYSLMLDWPYEAPPGDYMVTVYSVKDGHVTEKAETKVLVEQVGSVKTLANTAKNNGALYGIISITIALGAGFGVGLIFKKGGGAH